MAILIIVGLIITREISCILYLIIYYLVCFYSTFFFIFILKCKEAIDFINVIGNRLIAESGDSKSKKFLFERISFAIQRGNAASIRGTFPDSAILSEIFVL
jgi:hypothetical protein